MSGRRSGVRSVVPERRLEKAERLNGNGTGPSGHLAAQAGPHGGVGSQVGGGPEGERIASLPDLL